MKEILFYSKCFWCLEDFFSYVNGVTQTEVGYANGHTLNPTYKEVCDGQTGYEEVCKVYYNEDIVTIEKLLEDFFEKLNPKRIYKEEEKLLRQNQSSVLYTSEIDRNIILKVKETIENKNNNKLLTKVEPLKCYYRAEEEHQHYFKKYPNEASCPI